MPSKEYNVGCYLLDRLVEIGCGHLFGVPGDYNLRFLDDVMAQKDLKWVGCANELNTAYAADGYARCRRIAAMLTTYGVGELSAVNGIAGANAESCAIIHVVGGPSTKVQKAHAVMHHTLGDGDFEHFLRMNNEVCCAVCHLNEDNAQAEIDRVIAACLYHKKPVCVVVPSDIAIVPCEPPAAPLKRLEAPRCDDALAAFKAAVEEKLSKATSPVALVGYLCDRFECNATAQALVEETHMPFAELMLGKGALNSRSEHYLGTYYGKPTIACVREAVEGADVCVMLGVKFHDYGTGGFTQSIEDDHRIDIQPFESSVAGATFGPLPMKEAIEAVHAIAQKYCEQWPSTHCKPPAYPKPESDKFDMRHFWNEIQDGLQEGDILVVDQGTSSSATAGLVLPKNGIICVQNLWGSIGYSIPAAFGAQVAHPNRRVILIVGDGAAQMTVQELGSFSRYGLHPLLLLVNNDGYMIERVIHGWDEDYNDICAWDWCTIMKGMNKGRKSRIEVVREPGTTAKLLETHTAPVQELVFFEVMLGSREAPIVKMVDW